ncbi:hypothetical protein ABPG72_004874 [Tetrahymena utriculariae]
MMRKLLILLIACTAIYDDDSPLTNFTNNLLQVNGKTQTVLVSCFTDQTGMRDNNLYAGNNYAELSINLKNNDVKALGELPFGYKLKITYKVRSVVATKGDVGACGPVHPKIDIHKKAAEALGINNCNNFLENVQIEYLG